MKHLTIITGSSRGLGEALARQLLAQGHQVLGIARGRSAALDAFAAAQGATLRLGQWQADLADPLPVAERLSGWLAQHGDEAWQDLTLINNAGVVTPPGPVEGVPLPQLSAALRAGLEATLLLSAAFLDATRASPARRRILNISSGLGRRAMAGSAPYCAAKAGMDHLSRAMALDEAHKRAQGLNAAHIVSLAPGIIDTQMQVQLRSGDPAGFPDRQRFADFKSQGQLVSAEDTAERVLRFLAREDFGEVVVGDVRD